MTLRRDFFAFTAGAVVARTVLPSVAQAAERPDVGTVPDESQDAELLSWCAALLAMDAAWRRQMLDGDADLPPAYHDTLARVGKLAGDVEIEGAWLEWLGEQVMAQVAGLENYQAIAMGRRKA